MINLIILITIFFSADAKIKRISDQEMDLTRVRLIYMTPGRSTLVDMPCDISHSIIGLDEDIKITIGPEKKSTMSIWMSSDRSQPTNLTVRCGGEVFVFDLYPNKVSHQDYINIVDYYYEKEASSLKKDPKYAPKTIVNESHSTHKRLILSSDMVKKEDESQKTLLYEGSIR